MPWTASFFAAFGPLRCSLFDQKLTKVQVVAGRFLNDLRYVNRPPVVSFAT